MPHTCTRCNSVFESGEDILKGCPVCGWKKFMFVQARPNESKRKSRQEDPIINKAMGVRVPPKRATKEENEKLDETSPARRPHKKSVSELIPRAMTSPRDGTREGEKLESIKITAPGTYELNLPSLFKRDELIMAVKEGTYFIDLHSAFRKGKKD